jgi:nitrate/nitrite transport system ATP-binding protein
MTMDRYLEFSRIGKSYHGDSGGFEALRDVSYSIRRGEFVCLIGHSGCGKSTLLNIVAGLEDATSGGAILEGREIRDPGPERAVVFQHHALMPWLSCYENVELAVKQVFRRRKSRADMRDWILHNLELVSMSHAAHKRPHEISGGMRQRVGIARCLAMEPKVVLMDEPFGALDALTRAQLQDTVMDIHSRLACTVLMITHDVDEAVLLADTILMMTNGPAATIGDIVDVDLARPRERVALSEAPAFNHLRRRVLDFLYAARRPAAVPVLASAGVAVANGSTKRERAA